MDADLIKLIGSGGIAAALLALIYIVGMRMVRALDRVATKVDEHTTTDLSHHADVKESVVRLEGKVDAALDWQERTPVEGTRRTRTGARGVPVAIARMRGTTNNGSDDE